MAALRRIFTVVTIALACMLGAYAAGNTSWEEVTSPAPAVVQGSEINTDVAIVVSDGYIYVSSDKPVTVKIFSILGQLISQDNLKPGVHRVKLESRGIFILRAGSTTRRITL